MIEYSTHAVRTDRREIDNHLHAMGSQGWQLCAAIYPYSDKFILFAFSRQHKDLALEEPLPYTEVTTDILEGMDDLPNGAYHALASELEGELD